ncbi:zinc ribbon domain-containing protein [Levilactobacillus zymae]|uniref:zinc ribbon domain-containing protein n=1 Tax=Levilactobacillus zymae TaxID=267363 RepID=UPI0028B7082C|nr:zinc ribbon domain-containing protein [Levilactobacillus zymae]MDT6981197.1 zinc ribbon domain-containing protein [Levilactobacillus zymae]
MTVSLQFCPHCGTRVTAHETTCPQCHTDLQAFRGTDKTAETSPKLNLNALYANPYKEGMKRLKQRDGAPTATKPRRWWWPWSKE